MLWITLFGAITLTLCNEASSGEAVVYDSCLNADPTSPAFLMDCGSDGVIADIQYVAGAGQCSKITCQGESATLLIDVMDCHWNRKCRLSPGSPAERIVRSSDTCYIRSLSFLHIKGYRCFHRTHDSQKNEMNKIIDICDGGVISRTSGIIRSHADYPWNYRNGPRKCSLSLVVQRGTRLYVSALDDVDLGEDDALKVTSLSTRDLSHVNSSDGVLVVSDNRDTNVTFTFDVSDFTQLGKGFALCFKFSDTEIKESVCNEITTRGSLQISKGDEEDSNTDVNEQSDTDSVMDQTPIPETVTKQPDCDKKCQRTEQRRLRKLGRPKAPGEKGGKQNKKNRKNKEGKRRKREKQNIS